jgi:transcriptional regulator with XRE-family HTH domain
MRRETYAIVVRFSEADEPRIEAAAAAHFNDNKSRMLRTALELLLIDIEAGTYPPRPAPRAYSAGAPRQNKPDAHVADPPHALPLWAPPVAADSLVEPRLAPAGDTLMANPTFGEWLRTKLEHRHWSQAELVRRANVSSGTVSNWILEKRLPDPISCETIANAFDIPIAEVLNAAGYPLDAADTRQIDLADDHLTDVIMLAFGRLSPVAKQRLLDTITEALTTHYESASEDPDQGIPLALHQRDGRHKER